MKIGQFATFREKLKTNDKPTHIAHIGKPHKPTLKPKLAKEYNLCQPTDFKKLPDILYTGIFLISNIDQNIVYLAKI
jgi:hypothetical protein